MEDLDKVILGLRKVSRILRQISRETEEDLFEELIEVKKEEWRRRIVQYWEENKGRYLAKIKDLKHKVIELESIYYPWGKILYIGLPLGKGRGFTIIIPDIEKPHPHYYEGLLDEEQVLRVMRRYTAGALEDLKNYIISVLPKHIFVGNEIKISYGHNGDWTIYCKTVKEDLFMAEKKTKELPNFFNFLEQNISRIKKNLKGEDLKYLKILWERLLKFEEELLGEDLEKAIMDYEALKEGINKVMLAVGRIRGELKRKFLDRGFWERISKGQLGF